MGLLIFLQWICDIRHNFLCPLRANLILDAARQEDIMSGTYKDLEVWQAAMEMAVQVYRLTVLFPKEEKRSTG